MIIRVDKYTDENGRLIEECTVVDNENPKPFDRYIGTAALQIDLPTGSQRQPFKFKIEANSIKEAFVKFTEFATKEANAIEKKQMAAMKARQAKIEIASKIPQIPSPSKKGKIII
jgi:hypothetical protein